MVIGYAIAAPVLIAAGGGGAALLRADWADRSRARLAERAAGWAVFAAAIAVAMAVLGVATGLAAASAFGSLGVLAVVWRHAERRDRTARRDRGLAPEPLAGPSRAWRGWMRALLAGPLGLAGAIGLSFAVAAWMPGAVQTRLLVGGLLVPFFWALTMTWTLADQRLVRAAAVLVAVAFAGYGLALMGRVA